MNNKKRIIVYIALIVLFLAAIEFQKSKVRERRNAETVGLGKEIQKFGIPVDTEVLAKNNLYEVNRVSVERTSPTEFRFYLTREEKQKIKPAASVQFMKSSGDKVIFKPKMLKPKLPKKRDD